MKTTRLLLIVFSSLLLTLLLLGLAITASAAMPIDFFPPTPRRSSPTKELSSPNPLNPLQKSVDSSYPPPAINPTPTILPTEARLETPEPTPTLPPGDCPASRPDCIQPTLTPIDPGQPTPPAICPASNPGCIP